MIFKKVNVCQLLKIAGRKEILLNNYNGFFTTKDSIRNTFNRQMTISHYRFSQIGQKNPPMSQTKITFEIQKANSSQQLRSILQKYSQSINLIHRTVMLQKVTQRPFDQDQQLIQQVVSSIKANWKNDYSEPTEGNSRAIANTICYMSRKRKFHNLDPQFAQIDYSELAKHLNHKQFVMTLNGLLKLELIDKINLITKGKFSLQNFIRQNVSDKFFPSLLVSMWFNLLKYQKSSQAINNFFAQLLKNKHFKSNLIDYMQIVYCYVNSEGQRTIDLTYPVLTHPNELNPKTFVGAHQLSVLYEQLAQLKKIKDIYFSEQFNEVLETCYLKILNESNVPLRNVANVFNCMVQYENPTSKILDATFHKFFAVMKIQIALLEKAQPNKKPRTNVDSLSFVSLFNQLLQHYQSSNKYLNQMVTISMNYIDKIAMNIPILKQYNQRTFIRLLSGIDLAKKMFEQKNQTNSFSLTKTTKSGLQRQILKRKFNEVSHLSKLINFTYNHDIRSKEICHMFKQLIQFIPKDNQAFSAFQERVNQKCILNKNCKNCKNCFSK